MSFNFKLDSNNDIIIGRGAERLEGVPYVAQLVKNRLSTLGGEWDLDESLGIPWHDILGRGYDLGIIQGILSQHIRDTEGVDRLVRIDLTRLPNRQLSVDFSVESDGTIFTDIITLQ